MFAHRCVLPLTATVVALPLLYICPSPLCAEIMVTGQAQQSITEGQPGTVTFTITNTGGMELRITDISWQKRQIADNVRIDPDTVTDVTREGAREGDILLPNSGNTATVTFHFRTPQPDDNEDKGYGQVQFKLTVEAKDVLTDARFAGQGSSVVQINDPVSSPEPSTFTLLGVGTFGLIGWGWRRWKRTK